MPHLKADPGTVITLVRLYRCYQSETDRRPEWLRRKHGKQRSEPYLGLLAARCTAAGDGGHQHTIVIRTVHDLDGNELPIADEDEARNVVNALYRSRPAATAAIPREVASPGRLLRTPKVPTAGHPWGLQTRTRRPAGIEGVGL